MLREVAITRIYRTSFDGPVYNLELETKDLNNDDLFWIEGNTGIVTHNCLPKDLANLIACLGDEAVVTAAAQRRNLERDRPAG